MIELNKILVCDMNNEEAKDFFMKESSYTTCILPKYINLKLLLDRSNKFLNGKPLSNFLKNKAALTNAEGVNYNLISNKDGNYGWRSLDLIHPVVYTDLVNTITSESNWEIICERIKEVRNFTLVECISFPFESKSTKTDKASAIQNWWENFEQEQIYQAIEFEYCGHTDISDCYGSIYTHSIAWALHTREWAKKNRQDKNAIGNLIDKKIQSMRSGQTNGIPQGSILMDFIAEIVLLYADEQLTKELSLHELNNFKIIRYRDDYRIFSNNKQTIERILKILSEILSNLNMKLNTSKTFISEDIIRDAIKADKLYWDKIRSNMETGNTKEKSFKVGIQKHLLEIKILADKYPHSGSIRRALMDIFEKRIKKIERVPTDIYQCISIVVDVMIKNPNSIENCILILSKLVSMIEIEKITLIIDKILKKFENIPNTDLAEIWLQRLSLLIDRDKIYHSALCHKIQSPKEKTLWNSEWLKKTFSENNFVDEMYIDEMSITIDVNEINFFNNIYLNG